MTTFEAKSKAAVLAPPRPLSMSPVKADKLDLLVRVGVAQIFRRLRKCSLEESRQFLGERFARYEDDAVKVLVDYTARGATAPATTYTPGWAADLVATIWSDVVQTMLARSAFAQLASMGLSLNFGRAGRIVVPTFNPSAAGTFVLEGEPIPVAQGDTAGPVLTRKKMSVIVSFSHELTEASVPAIEALLRARIQESTAVALDTVLLDDQPATDRRPAGLLHDAVVVTSTDNLQGDLQTLASSVFESAHNHVRQFVMICNPAQTFAARLGVYRDVCPIITSAALTPGTVVMLDAADFICAGSDMPRFDISKETALHFESDTPQHITNGGVASPTRSLWQTDSLGMRMIWSIDWALRRPEAVAVLHDVLWQAGGGGGGARPTPPTYVQPIFTLAGTAPLGVEVGSSFVPTLTANWTQNDAGDATAFRLTRNGTQIFSSTPGPGDWTAPHPAAPETNIAANVTFASFVDHGQGVLKNDSEGNPHPSGRVPARTNWPSNTVIYLAQRRAFFGVLTTWPIVPDTEAFIRALADSMLNPVNGSTMSVDVPIGAHGAVFAYPFTLRAPTSIIQQSVGFNVASGFTTVTPNPMVGGVGGVSPVAYRVVFRNPEFPFTTAETFVLTI